MPLSETAGLLIPLGMLGALTTMMAVPVSMLIGVAAVLGIGRETVDERVAEGLEELLKDQSQALRKQTGRRLLDFPTSEVIPAMPVGLGFGRVRIVRTILAAIHDGYRVRLRAFGAGARGRVIVRHVDVELRKRR